MTSNNVIGKNFRAFPNAPMTRATIIGHTTKTSVSMWVRTRKSGQFALIAFDEKASDFIQVNDRLREVPMPISSTLLEKSIRHDFVTTHDGDTSLVIKLDNLTPNTTYRYAIVRLPSNSAETDEYTEVCRVIIGHDEKLTFKTLPAQIENFSFAFYSCNLPYKQGLFGDPEIVNIHMWKALLETVERHSKKDLLFVIGGGDQIYSDGVDDLNLWDRLNKLIEKKDGALYPDEETLRSWYRETYRAYWGFNPITRLFGNYPNYMIWDDHELGDGWGSYILNKGKDDELEVPMPALKKKRSLNYEDCMEMYKRMGRAAKHVYYEFQDSHNPQENRKENQYDYQVNLDNAAFYFLDGRGHRDINRNGHRVLGMPQRKRFVDYIDGLDDDKEFVFVISAVPFLHWRSALVNNDHLLKKLKLADDLRDSWEHDMHKTEREHILKALFRAAEKGKVVTIVSGDVHLAAAFVLTDPNTGAKVFQATSSAITYNAPRILHKLLFKTQIPDDGTTKDGYEFERLALYMDTNYSVFKVDPIDKSVTFQLYAEQTSENPESGEEKPVTHSVAKIKFTNPRPNS